MKADPNWARVIGTLSKDICDMSKNFDPVNAPQHYTDTKIQPIDFIEDKSLNFHLGNAVKYIARAGKKGHELEDLKKARWYLDRWIQNLEAKA